MTAASPAAVPEWDRALLELPHRTRIESPVTDASEAATQAAAEA